MTSQLKHTATAAAVSTLRAAIAAALVVIGFAVPSAAPAEEAGGAPAVIVRVAAADDIREGFVYLARLAGRGDAARDWDRLIATATAGRGLAGIDRRRPAGAYGWIGPHGDDGAAVVLVPVTGERAFLDLVENGLHAVPEAGGDGVYTAGAVDLPGLTAAPVYFRIVRGWAYLTARDRGALRDGRLVSPAAVLSGQRCAAAFDFTSANVTAGGPGKMVPDGRIATVAGDLGAAGLAAANPVAAIPAEEAVTPRLAGRGCDPLPPGMVSVSVDLQRIPAAVKEMVLGQLDASLTEVRREASPLRTPGLRPFLVGMLDEIGRGMATQLFEGGDTSLQLDLDRKRGLVALTVTIAARPGTAMAAAIADFSQSSSATAGLLRRDAALAAAMNVVMLKRERDLLSVFVDGIRHRAVAASGGELERIAVATAFDTLKPTLDAGEIDWAFSLLGPGSDGLYSLIGAVKVRAGAGLQRMLRLAPAIDPVTDIRFAGTVGRSAIHRLTLNAGDAFSRAFGGNAAYVAFRDDAVFVAAGPRGLSLVREALPVAAVTTPRIAEFRITPDRLAPLSGDGAAEDIARSGFGGDRRGGTIRLTVEGGSALRLRLLVPAKVIEFAGAVGHGMQ